MLSSQTATTVDFTHGHKNELLSLCGRNVYISRSAFFQNICSEFSGPSHKFDLCVFASLAAMMKAAAPISETRWVSNRYARDLTYAPSMLLSNASCTRKPTITHTTAQIITKRATPLCRRPSTRVCSLFKYAPSRADLSTEGMLRIASAPLAKPEEEGSFWAALQVLLLLFSTSQSLWRLHACHFEISDPNPCLLRQLTSRTIRSYYSKNRRPKRPHRITSPPGST